MPRSRKQKLGIMHAMAIRRTKCMRCNGRGMYLGGWPLKLVDPCPVCKGTGKRSQNG